MIPISPELFATPWMLAILIVLIIWDGVWKAISLWKSARNGQLGWFVAVLLVNSLGILPIVYIRFFQKKKKR